MEKGFASRGQGRGARSSRSVLGFASAGVGLTLGLLVVAGGVVAACSSSSDDSTFTPSLVPEDEGGSTPGPIVPDSGNAFDGGGASTAPASCDPKIPDGSTPSADWKPPTKTSACKTADIQAYFDNCLADVANQGKCSTFTSDPGNETCAKCMEPDDGSGPIQWHQNRLFYTVNTAGCLALRQGESGAGSCAEAYAAAVDCNRASCEGCFSAGGNFDSFQDCEKAAAAGSDCKKYQTDEATACQGYKDAGSPALDCFKGASEITKDFITRVAGFFCGP